MVEKPLSDPNLKKIQLFKQQIKNKKTQIFIGYDHVVSDSINKFLDHLKNVKTSEIETLDVEFREHWGGIFDAHFWLDGPKDSYLGFTKLGGGALLEHSHAINLWQTISNELGFGKITEVSAKLDYFKDNELEYDKVSLLNVRSERGLIGRIVQDVVTFPTRKIARVQCKKVILNGIAVTLPVQIAINMENLNQKKKFLSLKKLDQTISLMNFCTFMIKFLKKRKITELI